MPIRGYFTVLLPDSEQEISGEIVTHTHTKGEAEAIQKGYAELPEPVRLAILEEKDSYQPPVLQPGCVCANPMQQMWCPYGHMTECHLPLTCAEARCDHYIIEEGYVDHDP